MKTLTIREVILDELHWPRNFLSPSGDIVRIDTGKWRGERATGFNPFFRWQRLLNSDAFLPVEQVLPLGCLIQFNPRLSDNREFIGLVEPTVDRSFPFGEWLGTHGAPLNYRQDFYFGVSYTKSSWVCSYISLTFIHDVSIKTAKFD